MIRTDSRINNHKEVEPKSPHAGTNPLSTLQESALETRYQELEAVLGDRFALSWRQCAVVGLACLLFVLISHTPLAPSSTWLLASRGEAILASGTLPQVDPTQPLSQGVAFRESSWLSSVFWAVVARQSLEAVSWTITLLGTVSLGMCAWLLWRSTRNAALVGAGLLWLAMLLWPQWSQGTPVLLVLPMWVLLIHVQTRPTGNSIPWGRLAVTVALLLLWANFDASVLVGVAYLAVRWAACIVTKLQSDSSNWRALLHDPELRFATLTLELSILATLFTPLGVGLWTGYWGHVSASAMTGSPLSMASLAGLLWMVSALVFAVVLRKHQGPLPWKELAPAIVLGWAALLHAPLLVWFAPLAVLALLPQLQQACGIAEDPAPVPTESADTASRPLLKFAYTLAAVLLCWIAFALSPLSQPLLGGQGRTVSQLFDGTTPVAAVRYLRENPVPGLVFAPAPWADLLQSRQGAAARVFATTQARSLPQQVNFDYGRLSRGETQWETTASRYGIDALVIDKQTQPMLAEAVGEGNTDWRVVLNDERALVLRRRGV